MFIYNKASVKIISSFLFIWLIYFLFGQQNNSRDYYLMLGYVFGILYLHYNNFSEFIKLK